MGRFLKIIIAVATCLTVGACGSKSDSQKAVDDANKSIEQSKKDADKAAEDAKKAGEQAAEDAKKAQESTLDITSAGGQPGSVSLTGALVVDDNTLDTRVKVTLVSGKSWRGQRPEVKSGTLALKKQMVESSSQELEKLKDDKSYFNFGCDISNQTELKELTEKTLDPADTSNVSVIKASKVLICDLSKVKSGMTLITAGTVVLSGLKNDVVGAVDKVFSITTSELEISGQNKLSAKGKEGSSTVLQGPSISISASKVSGNGSLEILSEGASYLGEKK